MTTYKTETYYEPVTTYKTSYYYEPVTSYRYSCSYDPCTGCPTQVATPCTSYRLRSQCCPVTSYLQRTACKPVTSYQMAYYWEPQTTCCQTTIGAPVYTQPAVAPATPPAASDSYGGAAPGSYGGTPPAAGDSGGGQPPTTTDSSRKVAPPEPPTLMPKADPNSYRQPVLGAPQSAPPPVQPVQPAKVRLDKIVSLPGTNVQGEVLDTKRQPQSRRSRPVRQRGSPADAGRGGHRPRRQLPRFTDLGQLAGVHLRLGWSARLSSQTRSARR